jgi:ABC-type sugar transport system ATPase subunit
MVEPVGDSSIVDLKVGPYVAKARASAEFKGEIGDKVGISINKSKIHIFDKVSRKLLV